MTDADKEVNVSGRSRSYRLFHHAVDRIRELLRAALSGITWSQQRLEQLLATIARAKAAVPGPNSSNQDDTVRVSFTEEQLELIQVVATNFQERIIGRLDFHLNEVILVALWSGLESYLQGIVEQVYAQNPSALATDKTIRYRELLSGDAQVVPLLISREVNHFGRLSIGEMRKYIKRRLLYEFGNQERAVLDDAYLLRNIVVHNSGFVRLDQQARLPAAVEVRDNMLQIPKDYIEATINSFEGIVERMDNYLVERWNIPAATDALFKELSLVLGTNQESVEPSQTIGK